MAPLSRTARLLLLLHLLHLILVADWGAHW